MKFKVPFTDTEVNIKLSDIEQGNIYFEALNVTPQFSFAAVDSATPSKRRNSF